MAEFAMPAAIGSTPPPDALAALPGIPKQPTAKAVADSIKASSEQVRLVPATIGRFDRVQTVWIECPTWCVVDHSGREGCLEDVMHYSDAGVVQVLTMTDDVTSHSEMYVNVSLDPSASDSRLRAAHLVVNDGGRDDAYLTPDMADELADDLVAFAAQIRGKARLVRLYNKAGR